MYRWKVLCKNRVKHIGQTANTYTYKYKINAYVEALHNRIISHVWQTEAIYI